MTPRIHPVILSGGAGTRLLPLSREDRPKQFLPLTGTQTLIQQTALRMAGFEPPILIGNRDHRVLMAAQMKEAGIEPRAIVLEPARRNTAPAAAVAALLVAQDDPQGLVFLLPADHAVTDEPAFRAAIDAAAAAAQLGFIMTFGIAPSSPETGYGYIRKGDAIAPGAFRVLGFTEKPAPDLAKTYVASGAYGWNSGMFLFRADVMLEELRRHAPEILAAARTAFAKSRRECIFLHLDEAAFAAAPGISIDYAVMEKTDRAGVVPCDIGWSDIGSWQALRKFAAGRADLADGTETRPWGGFRALARGEGFQVKEIVVNPASRISLQRHKHRREHWTVAQGTARVTRDQDVFTLNVNETTTIPLGATHRLENPGSAPLHVFEVQFGDYLGEDDIERFEDDYGRV